jgi:putative DNA primase/helicase
MGNYSNYDLWLKDGGSKEEFLVHRLGLAAEASGFVAHDLLNIGYLQSLFGGDISADRRALSCPGPDHSARDRSMSITLRPDLPEGVLVNSFSKTSKAEAWRYFLEVIDKELAERRQAAQATWVDFDPAALLAAEAGSIETPAPAPSAAPPRQNAERIAYASKIWSRGLEAVGGPGKAYLASRLLKQLPPSLMRYRLSGTWGTTFAPELMLAIRSIFTGSMQAVHRTRLPHLGNGPDRKIIGRMKQGAIMLTPFSEVMAAGEVAVSEGWESGLAAMLMGRRNVWALANAGNLEHFPVLAGIQKITILAEHCAANKRAREACALRWHDAGREVIIAKPDMGKDFADELLKRNSFEQVAI